MNKIVQPTLMTAFPHSSIQRIGIYAGGGLVVRSLIAYAAISHSRYDFSVFYRSPKTKVVLQSLLNDLPRLSCSLVDISAENVPLSKQCDIVVHCAGHSTEIKSAVGAKEALYDSNMAILKSHVDLLKDVPIIVVTNPTTRIVACLAEQHNAAVFGIGVYNDHLRFSKNRRDTACLVGAHNFSELAVGFRKASDVITTPAFDHQTYKEIVAKQDRFRLPAELSNFGQAWNGVFSVTSNLVAEFRWWGRQRLNTKYLETAYSCANAILDGVDTVAGKATGEGVCTLESRYSWPDCTPPACIGWPIDMKTKIPVPLYFTDSEFRTFNGIRHKYAILKNG